MTRSLLTSALAVLTALVFAATAQASTPRANLVASKLTAAPTTLQAGAAITATATFKNSGPVKAKATKAFFLFSADALRDGADQRVADVCDPCPAISDADGYCPDTIAHVKNGTTPPASDVQIQNLVITAVAGTRAWAQDATFGTSPGTLYGGIELDFASSGLVARNNHITVNGTITNSLAIDVATFTSLGADVPPPSPLGITGTQLAANPYGYDSLLIRISNSASAGPYQVTGWQMWDGQTFVVLPTIYGTLPTQEPGGWDRLDGIATHDSNYPVLLPRDANDIGTPGSL